MITEPDDLKVCLDLMDEHWPGYQTAKELIRERFTQVRDELALLRKKLSFYESPKSRSELRRLDAQGGNALGVAMEQIKRLQEKVAALTKERGE